MSRTAKSSKTPVIVFVSPKGGVGKTTAALTLASEILFQTQQPVTIIDADPNQPFKHWSDLGKKPEDLNIILDENEETILDNIERAKASSKVVIVDLEGTKNTRVTYAVSQADLVIIPVQASTLDANQAAEAIKLVMRTSKAFNRKIQYAILFTRIPAAIKTRNYSDIATQLVENNIPVLPSNLIEREAFKTMFATGLYLHDLPLDISNLEKAKEDSYVLAEAVIERLRGARQQQPASAEAA